MSSGGDTDIQIIAEGEQEYYPLLQLMNVVADLLAHLGGVKQLPARSSCSSHKISPFSFSDSCARLLAWLLQF